MRYLDIASQRVADSIATPPTGYQSLFQKSDGDWYVKNDAGNESFVFSPVRANIQSAGVTTIESTSDVDKINAALGTTLTAGSYLVTVSYLWRGSSISSSIEGFFTLNGSAVGREDWIHRQEPKDPGVNQSIGFKRTFRWVIATDTNPTVRLWFQGRTTNQFQVGNAVVEFEKVGGP